MKKDTVKTSNVELYLGSIRNKAVAYENTDEENLLVSLWEQKHQIALSDYENSRVNSAKVKAWRDAYHGIFYKLNEDGKPSQDLMKPLKKVSFELVENKVISRLPGPKMTPRYYSDLTLVNATEALLNHEINKMLSEEVHDESEHSCLIDSTTWLKVEWDPFDNTHERSGMPNVINCPIDTVIPQPGVADYRKLEYIFQYKSLTLNTVRLLYDRVVYPVDSSDIIDIVEVYYKNVNGLIGHFVYTKDTLTVLSNDVEWGMRKVRTCTSCSSVVPIEDECPICGNKHFKYKGMEKEVLDTDLTYVDNTFETEDSDDKPNIETIKAGETVPHYLIRQLPFVPKRTIKVPGEIYGISEVALSLEQQDSINKFMNKAENKSSAAKTVITKTRDTHIDDDNSDVLYVEVEDAAQAQGIQVKQIVSDINGELAMANFLYDSARSVVGITDTDQGKADNTAKSGDAKELQLAASQQRQSSSKIQRNSAYAGVYELIFKYLLAYSDEERVFISRLPDGSHKEEIWSKYMFLAKDKDGVLYYRDDFAWSVDNVAYITNDRETMWQLIDRDFLNGTTGIEQDPQRALKLYWQMKDSFGYPTAKYALKFLENSERHLPSQIEQALLNNPEAVQLALSYIQDLQNGNVMDVLNTDNSSKEGSSGSAGGARDGAGKANNKRTHTQQQGTINNKNKVQKEVEEDQ